MGFVASEAVDELSYDFNPHVNESGVIPEPSAQQVEDYRKAMIQAVIDTGLDPAQLTDTKVTLSLFEELMPKVQDVEAASVNAVSNLTGIPQATLQALPYRIRAAFLGWIAAEFFSPED